MNWSFYLRSDFGVMLHSAQGRHLAQVSGGICNAESKSEAPAHTVHGNRPLSSLSWATHFQSMWWIRGIQYVSNYIKTLAPFLLLIIYPYFLRKAFSINWNTKMKLQKINLPYSPVAPKASRHSKGLRSSVRVANVQKTNCLGRNKRQELTGLHQKDST